MAQIRLIRFAISRLVPEIDAAQDNAGRSAFELHGQEFASGTLLDPIAQPHELRLALIRLAPFRAFQIIHGGVADCAGYFLLPVDHRKQDDHPVMFIAAKASACECHLTCLLPRSSDAMTSCHATSPLSCLDLDDGCASLAFPRRRIDLRDFATAVGFGDVQPRDKCSAHLGAVPARYDTEPERLFCLDVTRRKILHEVCFQEGARSSKSNAG